MTALLDRLWSKVKDVEFPEQCWTWKASTLPFGYGLIRLGKRRIPAHKLAWQEVHGPVPQGLCVLHQCDNPPCVNPAHLFLGTKADNNRDMKNKGRANSHNRGRTHCIRGHEYSPENTYTNPRTKGRSCVECKNFIARTRWAEGVRYGKRAR